MSAEVNKALVRRMLEAVREAWTPDVVATFFAPDYRRHLTATTAPLTGDGQRERASLLRRAFPDAHFTLEDIFAEGDRVAYRMTFHGTQEKAFLGVPPMGKTVAVTFLAIVRIADGKIAEEWGGLDQVDLLSQLGASVREGTL